MIAHLVGILGIINLQWALFFLGNFNFRVISVNCNLFGLLDVWITMCM